MSPAPTRNPMSALGRNQTLATHLSERLVTGDREEGPERSRRALGGGQLLPLRTFAKTDYDLGPHQQFRDLRHRSASIT